MKYFENCKTEDEAKELYRQLAKKFHPDMGGSNEQMADLTKQFEDNDFDEKIKTGDCLNGFYNWNNIFTQAQQKAYQFNHMRTPNYESSRSNEDHIPFDHPIYEEMRKLRSLHQSEILKLKEIIDQKENHISKWIRMYNQIEMRNLELDKSEIELNLLNDQLISEIKKLTGEIDGISCELQDLKEKKISIKQLIKSWWKNDK